MLAGGRLRRFASLYCLSMRLLTGEKDYKKRRRIYIMTYTKPWEQGVLKVTENGRYFSCGDTPFFWMGDTAWLLFHRLTEEETRNYLRNRKELGYNIILADFLHSPEQKNCAGDAALVNGDFNRINRDGGFWKHVDSVIRIAEELGLYMGILPVWGSSIVAGAV